MGPGDHICVPFSHVGEIDELVATFLEQGLVRRERCLLASSSEHSPQILQSLRDEGVPVSDLTASGALLIADVEAFYRPTGRHDPQASLRLVSEVARQARADGYRGLRGAGGPLAWSNLPEDEQRAVGSYEAQVNEVLRREGVSALCLYDQRSAGAGPLKQMLRTHPRAILDGRLCENLFCGEPHGHGRDEAGDAESMLRALRASEDFGGDLGRMAGELDRLREREAARSEEVSSRNGLLRGICRQLEPQVRALEEVLRQATEPTGSDTDALSSGWRDRFEQVRDSAVQLRRLARQLEAANSYAAGTPPPVPQAGELTALTAATMESWRRSRQIAGTDVRLQSSAPVAGVWDRERMSSVVQNVLEAAWERGWGSPVDMFVEDLGSKARLTTVYEDMEVLAGTPFEPSTGADLVAHARDSLRVALWASRESVKGMGGSMGLSVWPDGRVSITIDLPRTPKPKVQV